MRGWLHAQSFTEPPEKLLGFSAWRLTAAAGEPLEWRLLEGRPHGRGLVVRLEGVATPEEAALLRGRGIEVRREELPPAGPREHYFADLVGLEVRNAAGVRLGRVEHFIDTPANAVMVVKGEREHWIPAVPRHLLAVEKDEGLVRVDWPEDF